MQRFNSAKAEYGAGKDPKIMLLQHAYVATDNADADKAAKDISRFYCYFGAWFKNEKPIQQGLIEKLTDEELANPMFSPEVMLNNMPIGTADVVIDKLKHYEALGYDEFSLWIDSSMTSAQKRGSLQRFINEVMPAFQ